MKFNLPSNFKRATDKGKNKGTESGWVFLPGLGGGGGRVGAVAGVNYLNPFMPRKLYLSSCDVRNLASCA